MSRLLIAGAGPVAAALADAGERAGSDVRTTTSPRGEAREVGGLAELLLEVEGVVAAEEPQGCLLADDSDAALAAALVAAKAEVPLGAAPAARSTSLSGRVIAQLAEELPADPDAAVAWVEAAARARSAAGSSR